MELWLEIALAFLAGSATLIQALGLYVLKDLQARVVRLEDLILKASIWKHSTEG